MKKKFPIPKTITTFFKNSLVQYKRVGKTKNHQFTIEAQVDPFNKHTGLDLKEIPVRERETWQKAVKDLREDQAKDREAWQKSIKDLRDEQARDRKIQAKDRKAWQKGFKDLKELILNMQENMNSRFDKIEKDIKLIKSLPTIKKELKEAKVK